MEAFPQIVIVGNGAPARNLSAPIDQADSVIRFNSCPHFSGGMTGSRTTILVLRAALEVGERFGTDSTSIPPAVAGAAREVWFLYGTAGQQRRILDTHGLQDRLVRTIDPGFIATMSRELELPAEQMPSAGMIAIALVLLDPAWSDHRVGIAGFGWSGWEGHQWARERDLCESLAGWGQLQILERKQAAPPRKPIRRGGSAPADCDELAAAVWRLCDGRRDLAQICGALAAPSQPASVRRWQVRRSLDRLLARGHITLEGHPP